MSSLFHRALVLTLARSINYAVLLLSPVLLVRILDLHTYGQYREFMLYGMGAVVLLGSSIASSLSFFVAAYESRRSIVASQTALLLLLSTVLGSALITVAAPWLLARSSVDLLPFLPVWVFFYLNLDFVEAYWLGSRRPGYVLAYSTACALARLLVVIVAAAASGNIYDILLAMIGFEVMKCLALAVGLGYGGVLRLAWDGEVMREQLRYIRPLWMAAVLVFANQRLGSFVVSAQLGAAALALYTIGTYQLPVMSVIRAAVADTLFPDLVERVSRGDSQGLEWWQRTTVLYCVIAFPVVALFFVAAGPFIRTLFTQAYAEAVPVFQVSLLLMLPQCFDMGLLLRAKNQNSYTLWGNLGGLIAQLPLVFVFLHLFGLVGAAAAMVVSDIVILSYLAPQVMRLYDVSLVQFVPWREVGAAALAALAALPLLLMPVLGGVTGAAAVAVAVVAYLSLYSWIILRLRLRDIAALRAGLAQRLRRR